MGVEVASFSARLAAPLVAAELLERDPSALTCDDLLRAAALSARLYWHKLSNTGETNGR
jgi:hypothetical protein